MRSGRFLRQWIGAAIFGLLGLWAGLPALAQSDSAQLLPSGASLCPPTHPPERDYPPRTLVIGRLSDNPAAFAGALQPILDLMVRELADVGVIDGRILMARDAAQMASYLRQGKVDWLGDTAAVALQLMDRGNAEPVAIVSKNGASQYRSLLVARSDSGIQSLADLAGRTIAFQNSSSTTAYYLPAGMLLEAGLRLEILSSPLDRPPPKLVGYAFARVPANSAAWVHKRVVDAVAVSDQDWNNPKDFPPSFRNDLRVFARSPLVPRAIELVRGDLDDPLRERLVDCLTGLHRSEAGQQILRSYFGAQQMLPSTAADHQALESLRPWLQRVREEVE